MASCWVVDGRPRASPVQRQALRLLALEHTIARPYLCDAWETRRDAWRSDVDAASHDANDQSGR